MKFLKFFEYVYLGVAILSLIEVFNEWNSPDKTRLYIFILFAAVSLFMFFFRRRYRQRFENRRKDQ
ncbi:hypothetical protein [Imtechella halotolerans]|uniref:hypothetical protein n=1 Tax=Imtechella halotolerans TaxID=1165090 RepID=UPI00031836F0|nr:hypothetical protein [Imtechella halotolerans]WMQ63289.1 hypothetical protein PT603_13265 [Imtechella halotolerans]